MMQVHGEIISHLSSSLSITTILQYIHTVIQNIS